ncbi:UvrD-helicase domain-containing protein [Paenibacillus sedimenti]|uniref:UvrD-helicase domain-containing protein n=1 Tax=Paenibacillus sedimenti TaxID=2770274 RepID=A0A926KXU3_9BACL|nr:UvrD-helicase domain-containing protein [Paenibacillus sedimenti]MBD0384846.1 UvrD-helicase domain-containing protein [Paenibacillus sedimenti]
MNIEISDRQIDQIEQLILGDGVLYDKKRREIIKLLTSADIKASPGSGKTTLLLTKLLIIISQLDKLDVGGICVLTHTNVGIDEIKNRLGDKGNKLFSYPNYVGTIQGFVNKFLAAPIYIKQIGKRPAVIDSSVYDSRIAEGYSSFFAKGIVKEDQNRAKSLLRSNPVFLKDIRFNRVDGKTKITNGIGLDALTFRKPRFSKTKIDFTTEEKREIEKWLFEYKMSILRQGILHYDDAYFLATFYIEKHENKIKEIISKRFKYVFIDEMQDTYQHQIDILDKVFSSDVIIQRFGDSNQAIYGSHNDKDILGWIPQPSEDLHLSESKRFGESISKILETVCPEHNIHLKGESNVESFPPHLFLFSNKSRSNVLFSFAEIVDNFTSQCETFAKSTAPIKAVGWIGKEKDDLEKKLSISSYFNNFDKSLRIDRRKYSNLISYLGKEIKKDIGTKIYVNKIFEAFVEFLSLMGIKRDDKHFYNIVTLKDFFHEKNNSTWINLNVKVSDWVSKINNCTSEYNSEVHLDIKKWFIQMLKEIWDKEIPSEGPIIEFLDSTEPEITKEAVKAANQFIYPNNESLIIDVNTIHSVKGETHKATLLLDTYFNRKYHLTEIKEFIKGDYLDEKARNPLTNYLLRLAFVALSRPTHLVGIAYHEEHLSEEDITKFTSSGWTLIRVPETI